MNLKIRALLKQFEKLRLEYVKAWKSGVKETADKLRYKLAEISEALRQAGIAIGMLPENLTYLQNSLSTCTRSATTEATATALIRDVENMFEL